MPPSSTRTSRTPACASSAAPATERDRPYWQNTTVGAAPSSAAATLAIDEADVNRVLLDLVRVGDAHGVKFPRAFGLLLKQVLYFDRYTRALAPGLDIVNDARVNLGDAAPPGRGAGGRVAYG